MWAMNASIAIERAALAEAISRAGGKTALLRLLNARGHHVTSHNTITQWSVKQVPAHYCPDIEFVTGVMCESLRPDVAWGVVRNSSIQRISASTSPTTDNAEKSTAAHP